MKLVSLRKTYNDKLPIDKPKSIRIKKKGNNYNDLSHSIFNRFDNEVIDDYDSLIRNASTTDLMDPIIKVIVMEEIPAYFAGQKTIEEVAAIIDNRAQTVIDERG